MNFDLFSFFLGVIAMGIFITIFIVVCGTILNIVDIGDYVKPCIYDDVKIESIDEIKEHYKEQYCIIMVAEKIKSKLKKKRLIKIIKKKYQQDVDYFERPEKVSAMLKNINDN